VPCHLSTGEPDIAKPTDLAQGTLDLLILRTLALQPMHGWGIAQRIRQVSKEVLQVNQGALLSRAASPRETGLDSRQMGRIGKQSPRQILFAHSGWRKVPVPAAGTMEAPFVGNWASPRDVLKEPEHALALHNASALSLAFPQR